MQKHLFVVALAGFLWGCAGDEGLPVGEVTEELGGWAPTDPRLAEWIRTVHSDFHGQGSGDQGPAGKPTTCRFNSNRRCIESPHGDETTCLQHRTPAPGFWLETFDLIHCLDVVGCPFVDGNRVGDISAIRLCKENPVPQEMTVCGMTGPEGCASSLPPCGVTAPPRCGI